MLKHSWRLEGKSILVTGSNRGIGKGIAQALAGAGASVGVTFSGSSPESEAKARDLCKELEGLGGKAIAISVNVADEDQCKAAVDRMVKEFGGLYGLVNNAGVAIDQLTLRYKADDWDKLMAINLKGSFMMSKAALRPMMKAEGASIVNMSSVVGQMGNAGQAVYAASKAGLIGMTKSLAREFASRQIRVNALAPGFIDTEMTQALSEEQRSKLSSEIPLQSLGTVEDIAAGTLYLLSPMSQYVTGQVLGINGGLYM
ncbi:MAG: 3-oxoacyl-ACP reductase family protein [Bdellovibrionota bacterium]